MKERSAEKKNRSESEIKVTNEKRGNKREMGEKVGKN